MNIKQVLAERQSLIGKEVEICGWVRNHRQQKSIGFIDFYDGTVFNPVQLVYEIGKVDTVGVKDSDFESLIETAECSADPQEAEQAYTEVLDSVVNRYAVEIPVYRKVSRTLFSTLRIDVSTLPESMTGYYGWADEAEKLKLRK